MLSVVPTPIGNLDDITIRALAALQNADLIAAEDTRHSGILLKHHGISKPLISFHEHNEASRTADLIERLAAGIHIALITDAGMPSISDPGVRLVRACIQRELPFTVLPGPCALVTALVGSGLDNSAFYFGGFLPVKSGQRTRVLENALARTETCVFYESPYRLVKSLTEIVRLAPDHHICVARELTKKFEEFRAGPVEPILAHYTAHPPKGEICLVL